MRRWIQDKSSAMSEEALSYWISTILFALALITLKPSRYFDVDLPAILTYMAIGFLFYGFWTYLSPALKKASESLLFKALWAGVTITGVTFSFSLAQLIVNETLKVPSSAFPHTQTLVAVLVAPVVIGIFVFVIGLILTPILQIIIYSENGELSIKSLLSPRTQNTNSKWAEIKYFIRFIALISVLGLCVAGLARNKVYLNGVRDFVRWYAFHFETESHSSCLVDSEVRVGYLNDGRVITASKNDAGYSFQVSECMN